MIKYQGITPRSPSMQVFLASHVCRAGIENPPLASLNTFRDILM